ncbi:hypothetical protein O181_073991 [Austropuccinia psidii MF-1]|uniref:Uncharacterized protein n=1 Tax=Austropuccinia psidii MF-1 TaxID=1389203 RepID=A0A9Q3FC58_9BASI|nr:hypothetical protein [Austropuccinia psidii MF-1]
MNQAINIIKEDNKKVLDDIENSLIKVKTYTIALKKSFNTSQQEVSKLTMKLNQVTSDKTRQTELWQELTHKEDMYKIEVISFIQSFQHEFRNSQRCSSSKMNDIEQLLHTLPRISKPLNQNEGSGIPNPQVLDVVNSQLKMNFPLLFITWNHQWAKHSWKKYQNLQNDLTSMVKEKRFNTLFTRSAHRWYIKLRHTNSHQSWTWWKTQIIKKWANDAWRCNIKTAFDSAKFNAEKDKALPWFCQKKDRLTALYPDMSELMIHKNVVRQCGGDLDNSVNRRKTEQSSEDNIINILEEVTTRARIGSSRVNLKTRFNTPWKDSVDKNPK